MGGARGGVGDTFSPNKELNLPDPLITGLLSVTYTVIFYSDILTCGTQLAHLKIYFAPSVPCPFIFWCPHCERLCHVCLIFFHAWKDAIDSEVTVAHLVFWGPFPSLSVPPSYFLSWYFTTIWAWKLKARLTAMLNALLSSKAKVRGGEPQAWGSKTQTYLAFGTLPSHTTSIPTCRTFTESFCLSGMCLWDVILPLACLGRAQRRLSMYRNVLLHRGLNITMLPMQR